MSASQRDRFNLRLDSEVRDRLQELADDEGVTLNAFAQSTFEWALEECARDSRPRVELVRRARAIDAARRRRA